MRFQPSAYGAEAGETLPEPVAPAPVDPAAAKPSDMYETYAKAAREFFGIGKDVRTILAQKKANLASYLQQLPYTKGLTRAGLEAKIRNLRAEISALEVQASEEGLASAGRTAAQVLTPIAGIAITVAVVRFLWKKGSK